MQPEPPEAWDMQLLGGVRLRRGDREVRRFRTRGTDAVFAFLALHLGQRVRREALVELVWPEADQQRGNQSLRMALTAIRGELGPETVDADRQTVRLNPQLFDSDVERLGRKGLVPECPGRLLEGMEERWIEPYAQAMEDQIARCVIQSMEQLPPEAARSLGEEAQRRFPSRLDIRAKLRQGLSGSQARTYAAPLLVTSFIGRQVELREIETLISQHRLVTITGLGGSGQSRLAGEIWSQHQPNSWFIGLADFDDPSKIAEQVREGFRLPVGLDVSALDQVTNAIGTSPGILVLDNFEHLVSGAGIVLDLLRACPNLAILATSQVPLNVVGEVEYPLGPLSLIPSETDPLSDGALLFESRARDVLPGFSITPDNLAAVNELCRRLDGFPLALVIAASKSRVFNPAEMVAQLDDRFEFLARRGGAEKRHQSLRTALDWSFERLSEPDQNLLTELSVFRGGFTLEAAEAVCRSERTASQIETLLGHAWLERVPDSDPTRFRMLESIREFGAELLSPRRRAELGMAHADYYLGLSKLSFDHAFMPDEPAVHRLLEADIANLDAAWSWLRKADPHKCLAMVTQMNWFWILKGQSSLGEERLTDAIARVTPSLDRIYAWAHQVQGNFIIFQARWQDSLPWFEKALRLGEETQETLLTGLAATQIAQCYAKLGRRSKASDFAERGISDLKEFGDDNWLGAAYVVASQVQLASGDTEMAYEMGRLAVDHCRRGGYPWGLASALNDFALACSVRGDHEMADRMQLEAIALKGESRAPQSLALSYADQAGTLLCLGRFDDAKECARESLRLLRAMRSFHLFPHVFGISALLLHGEGNQRLAMEAFTAMTQLRGERPATFWEGFAEQHYGRCCSDETGEIDVAAVAEALLAV